MSDTGGSRAPRSLLTVTVFVALLCGAAFLAIDWLHSSSSNAVEHPGPAATDEQTRADVVGHAKDIVAITGLAQPTAGYLLLSCKNQNDPPYQGAVYLTFVLPADVGADAFFRTSATALVAHGWTEGPPPNQHLFGRNLSRDGVSALLYPDRDSSTRGVVRIHGPCRDITDHRRDSTAWLDITDSLK
jgi:hypothetical protein